jgi:transcriptional regulator with XRE-family HTH domain
MNATDYFELRGTKKAREVAEKAGISYPYFWQISRRLRRPSPEVAERLVEASGHELDFVSLLRVETRKSVKDNAESAA